MGWLYRGSGLRAILLLSVFLPAAVTAVSVPRAASLLPSDRVLVLAPHPDDEVLGCAGVLQRALAARVPVRVVFLTYGDDYEMAFWHYERHPVLLPREALRMGEIRHAEAEAAARALGVPSDRLIFLGYPDRGTMRIWEHVWGSRPPLRSGLTRVTSVPYASARRPGAPYRGDEILKDLTEIIRDFRPTKIFVSHPADMHRDHRGLYLFTRVAVWDSGLSPVIEPYLVHFPAWPRPRGLQKDLPLEPPDALRPWVEWSDFPLSEVEEDRKQRALACHRSQLQTDPQFLSSFIRRNELFGDMKPVTPGPTVTTKNGELEIVLERDALQGKEETTSVFVFGYRPDRPFAQMPKLHVRWSWFAHNVQDSVTGRHISDYSLDRSSMGLTLRIPLGDLGFPDRVFVGTPTPRSWRPSALEKAPFMEWVAWRVISL